MQQVFITFQRRGSTLEGDLHTGGAIGVLAHQPDGRFRDLVQIHRAAFGDAHAREVEELREQARQPVAFAHDQIGQELLVRVRAGRLAKLLDRASNGGQRILDLVRQTRRQLRHRLEPLGAQVQLL